MPAGELDSAFADITVVTAGHGEDEVVGISRPGRRLNLRHGGVPATVGDVFGDRPVKKEDILQDNADLVAQGKEGDVLYIDVINQNLPGRRVIEAGDQADQGGFANAGGTDDRQHLPGVDREGDIFQDIITLVMITERNPVKGDFSLHLL